MVSSQGMKTTIHPRFQPLNSPPLLLVGVGMRKKTFLFIDVDVYLIAINISSNELRRAKFWNNTAKESLSDVLLAENSQEKMYVTSTRGLFTMLIARYYHYRMFEFV